ncbi:hypothetical protein, partial [Bilophila wadsworthia]|uniref:hypothetical protein n=1 Tax=Bilophila wadsworthia TaxID=35833 RepID=UPI003A87BA91
MLTEQERKWLEERKNRPALCGGPLNYCGYGCLVRYGCPLTPDYQDAAEFEARVAEKLAEHAGSYNRRNGFGSLLRPNGCSWYKDTGGRDTVCPPKHDIDDCPGIPFCNLYLARIAVEEE